MDQETPEPMTLIDHLRDLRDMLIKSFWGILAGLVLAYPFSSTLFDWIRSPIQPYLPQGGLVFTNPIDKFMAHLKVTFFGGVLLSSPWWFYQVWRFVSPALYRNEKRWALGFISSALVLFAAGFAFTYFVVFPMAFKFLLNFGNSVDKPMITINEYLDFFLWTSLSFGLAFELPLVVVTLGLLGVVDAEFLKANRKYVIVFLAVLTAVVTPPDLLSMLMLLIPLWLLFDLSIFIVARIQEPKQRSSL